MTEMGQVLVWTFVGRLISDQVWRDKPSNRDDDNTVIRHPRSKVELRKVMNTKPYYLGDEDKKVLFQITLQHK